MQNILDVLKLAHQYGFKELESEISKYLRDNLSPNDVFDKLDNAISSNFSLFADVSNGIVKYIKKKIVLISEKCIVILKKLMFKKTTSLTSRVSSL